MLRRVPVRDSGFPPQDGIPTPRDGRGLIQGAVNTEARHHLQVNSCIL